MMTSNLDKKPTKAEMEKKVDAWKSLNSVLVQMQSEFMSALQKGLEVRLARQAELEVKLKDENATEDDHIEYLMLCGYIQALRDIIGQSAKTQV